MKITREDVVRVAELANLELSEAEILRFGGQLESILTYCEKLNELDTTGVEPMAQVLTTGAGSQGPGARDEEAEQHLREDMPVRARVVEEVLRGAPDPSPPYFRVPKVIER
jgi:aspartyl-tRNA(Asn)/glutamyl-tRNA(Gln) amidotransferase subunit C